MIQYDAINTILEVLITEYAIDACYLKGDFGEKDEDEYTKVEMTCLTSDSIKQTILKSKENIFEKYNAILFIEHKNNKIECVYENGLILVLQLLTKDEQDSDNKLIIYNPKNLVSEGLKKLKADDITELIHRFSFIALDYYAALMRENSLNCLYLVQKMMNQYITLYYYLSHLDSFPLKINKIWNILKDEQKKVFLEIFKWITVDKHLIAAKIIVDKMYQLIGHLPLMVANYLNLDFFLFAKNKISSISEEKA